MVNYITDGRYKIVCKIDILVFFYLDFQKFANILHHSGIVKDEYIKEILKVETFGPFDFGKPSKSPNVEEWELGRLANEIDVHTMVNLASDYFDEQLTTAQIRNIKSDQRNDGWSISFDILVKWSRKVGRQHSTGKNINKYLCN